MSYPPNYPPANGYEPTEPDLTVPPQRPGYTQPGAYRPPDPYPPASAGATTQYAPPPYQAPPSQGLYGQSRYPPPMAYPSAVMYPPAPRQDGGAAIVVEVIAGLVGFWGIGWLMRGYTLTGALLLVGGLVFGGAMLAVSIITFGAGLLCWGPLNIIAMVCSAIALSNRLRSGPSPI
jgi:hypothetical protein